MITLSAINNRLNNFDPGYLENLACQAKGITEQYFGRTISLYAPLYLSNYCSSHCAYCGFNNHKRIKRYKLTKEQMQKEMGFLAKEGIENILLLTGESYQATPLSYLKEAVETAKQYFPNISLEAHPMEESEYSELFSSGVDGLTVYQETYHRDRYKEVHLAGKKADYDYRYQTPERAAKAGIRNISLGILLGLYDVAFDLFHLYEHLRYLEKKYPGVEYSLSFPRLRPIKGFELIHNQIDDEAFVKIICLTRILFPRVGINLSTRESPRLRDHLLGIGVTRISAGSNTSVGGYTLEFPGSQDPQFDTNDKRPVAQIVTMLKNHRFDPVLTDWRRIKNEANPGARYQ